VSDATTSGSTVDREIVLERVFDAPRELVFAAWTDSRHVEHWWGPDGFTLTTQEIDVRPGGTTPSRPATRRSAGWATTSQACRRNNRRVDSVGPRSMSS
jgi:uncharacterized protein YndB with AHSA1/START domain